MKRMQDFILFVDRPFSSIEQQRDFVRECLKLMEEICMHPQLFKKKIKICEVIRRVKFYS